MSSSNDSLHLRMFEDSREMLLDVAESRPYETSHQKAEDECKTFTEAQKALKYAKENRKRAPRARYFSTSEADIPSPPIHGHHGHGHMITKDDIEIRCSDDSRTICSELIQDKPLEKAETMENLPEIYEMKEVSIEPIKENEELEISTPRIRASSDANQITIVVLPPTKPKTLNLPPQNFSSISPPPATAAAAAAAAAAYNLDRVINLSTSNSPKEKYFSKHDNIQENEDSEIQENLENKNNAENEFHKKVEDAPFYYAGGGGRITTSFNNSCCEPWNGGMNLSDLSPVYEEEDEINDGDKSRKASAAILASAAATSGGGGGSAQQNENNNTGAIDKKDEKIKGGGGIQNMFKRIFGGGGGRNNNDKDKNSP